MVAYALTLMVLLSRNAFPDTEEGGGQFHVCDSGAFLCVYVVLFGCVMV